MSCLWAQLLGILRTNWRLARPQRWLVPGRDEAKPIDVQVLHAACRSACAAAGLGKHVLGKHVTFTRCGTALLRICWRPAPTSASFREHRRSVERQSLRRAAA